MYPTHAPKDSQELWEVHHKLILKIAHKLHKSYPNHLELEEKISYAFEGMANCLDKWDKSRKVKFSTYAYTAATRAILRAIEKETVSRRPGPIREPGKYGSLSSLEETEQITSDIYKSNQYSRQNPIERITVKRGVEQLHGQLKTRNRSVTRVKTIIKLLLAEYRPHELATKLKVSRQNIHQILDKARSRLT